mgnify:CR=1 FL=1
MSNVRRVYVEKKGSYDVQQKALAHEIRNYLGIKDVEYVRILNRYDVENVSDETFERACNGIFAEPPVDVLWKEEAPVGSGDSLFSVEFLPGQFDQRADSAVQCIQFVKEDEQPVIRTATTYIIHGKNGAITEEELQKIKEHCINPVDSREAAEEKPETLVTKFDEPADVIVFDGFKDMEEEELKKLYDSLGLAMTFRDFQHIQNHFKGEEHRDPSMTEIRVLDTYWSDHCRHTTFSTELTEVSFGDGDYRKPMEDTYKQYLRDHSEIFKGREDKFVCLMDLALMAMRKLKKEGKLQDQEESDEINACSIVVPIKVDGVEEEWLVNFKNETHNHPTEIEPFGGAATCLGGAIRDPLSGRTYVYQAMRVTGAARPGDGRVCVRAGLGDMDSDAGKADFNLEFVLWLAPECEVMLPADPFNPGENEKCDDIVGWYSDASLACGDEAPYEFYAAFEMNESGQITSIAFINNM